MKKVLTVSFFTGLLTLFRMAAGFAIGKVVAVAAGPGGLAILGQLQGVISILTGIINSPVGPGIVKYTSENSSEKNENYSLWWRSGVIWLLSLCLVTIPVICLLSSEISEYLFSDKKYGVYVIVIALLLPLGGVGTFFISILNGFQFFRKYIIINFISITISTIVMIVLTLNYGIEGALLAASMQAGLIGVVIITSIIKQPWFRLKFFFGKISKTHFLEIRNYVLMALVIAFALPVALVFIRKMMVVYCGWQETGEWQAVWKISEAYLSIITLALATYYLPMIARIKDAAELNREIKSNLKILFPLAVLMAIIIYFMKDFIIYILFTPDFEDARRFFLVQLIGDVIKVVAWIYSYILLAKGLTKIFITVELSFAFAFAVLSFFGIKLYGIEGANYAYTLTYILYLFVVYKCAQKYVLNK